MLQTPIYDQEKDFVPTHSTLPSTMEKSVKREIFKLQKEIWWEREVRTKDHHYYMTPNEQFAAGMKARDFLETSFLPVYEQMLRQYLLSNHNMIVRYKD